MKIRKGTKLKVNDKRKGVFLAVANSDFDTEDEWYDIILDEDYLKGISNDWIRGEKVPARKGITFLRVIESEE